MTTKSSSSIFLSLVLLAPLAIACSSNVEPTQDTNEGEPSSIAEPTQSANEGDSSSTESDVKLGNKKKKKATCTSVGGQCVGLAPSSCTGGTWADATKVTCGGGIGVGCCISQCPQITPPAPGYCSGGTITPKIDANGCTTGYECVQPTKVACSFAGGSCVGLAPSSCPSGHWGDATTYSCGPGIGVGFCLP